MSVALLPEPTRTAVPSRHRSLVDTLKDVLDALNDNQSLSINEVTWKEYIKLADHRDRERHNVKISYDCGRMDIVAPSFFHDRVSRQITLAIASIVNALKIPVVMGGGTTFRREDLKKGLEPDECVYVQNAHLVIKIDEIDLSIYPPPDLAIEVDHTNSSERKESIYAALGVTELWRFNASMIRFYVRKADGKYHEQPHSLAIPLISSAGMTELIFRLKDQYAGDLIDIAREWALQLSQS